MRPFKVFPLMTDPTIQKRTLGVEVTYVTKYSNDVIYCLLFKIEVDNKFSNIQ